VRRREWKVCHLAPPLVKTLGDLFGPRELLVFRAYDPVSRPISRPKRHTLSVLAKPQTFPSLSGPFPSTTGTLQSRPVTFRSANTRGRTRRAVDPPPPLIGATPPARDFPPPFAAMWPVLVSGDRPAARLFMEIGFSWPLLGQGWTFPPELGPLPRLHEYRPFSSPGWPHLVPALNTSSRDISKAMLLPRADSVFFFFQSSSACGPPPRLFDADDGGVVFWVLHFPSDPLSVFCADPLKYSEGKEDVINNSFSREL